MKWICLVTLLFSSTINASVEVEIQGVENKLLDNVRLFLSIEQYRDNKQLKQGRLYRLHEKAEDEIRKALQPFGYYNVKVESSFEQISESSWLAKYRIEPGKPVLIDKFTLNTKDIADNDIEFKNYLDTIQLKIGDIFIHSEYEAIKKELLNLSSERGYFEAELIQHSVEINPKMNIANIIITFDSGPRYRFGQVIMEQSILKPELLEKYVGFSQGDYYHLEKLLDLQHALNDSDYFQLVEISPAEPLTDTKQVPISVSLKPRKPHRYLLGFGYGTDTGARGKIGWEMPRINDSGHRFNSEARISEIGYKIDLKYIVPVFNPRTDQLVYSSGVINETTDTSESTLRTIGVSLNRSRDLWRQTIAINYQQEDFIIADEQGDSHLLIPSVSWSRTWGKDFIHVLDGVRFDISIRGASADLLSDTTFSQLQTGIKGIHSFADNYRVIARGSVGSTWTESEADFQQLPSTVRFFTGGANSVRGYAYQSLGPLDENNEVIGGRHLITGSIELEYAFNTKWAAALFLDAGNAIDNINDPLEQGAGLGVRWQTPIGPVRIDIANAITDDDRPWRLHINIGPDL